MKAFFTSVIMPVTSACEEGGQKGKLSERQNKRGSRLAGERETRGSREEDIMYSHVYNVYAYPELVKSRGVAAIGGILFHCIY